MATGLHDRTDDRIEVSEDEMLRNAEHLPSQLVEDGAPEPVNPLAIALWAGGPALIYGALLQDDAQGVIVEQWACYDRGGRRRGCAQNPHCPMTPLTKELVVRALEDEAVSAYELPRLATRLAQATNPSEQRERSLEAVKLLLSRGLWIPGGVGGTFRPWKLEPEAAYARIESEWPLERLPDYGEICFFANTPLGNELAKRLVLDGFKTLDDDWEQ